jgi:hypothetical protein
MRESRTGPSDNVILGDGLAGDWRARGSRYIGSSRGGEHVIHSDQGREPFAALAKLGDPLPLPANEAAVGRLFTTPARSP